MKLPIYRRMSAAILAISLLFGHAPRADAGTQYVEATGTIGDERSDAEFKFGEPVSMRFAIDTSVEGQPLDFLNGDTAPWLQFFPALEHFEIRIADRHYSGSGSDIEILNDALLRGDCYDRWILTMTPNQPRQMPSGRELLWVQLDLQDYQECDMLSVADLSHLPILQNASHPLGRFRMFNDETLFMVTSLRIVPEPTSCILFALGAGLLFWFSQKTTRARRPIRAQTRN